MADAQPGPAISWGAYLCHDRGQPVSIRVQPLGNDPPNSILLEMWWVRQGPWGDGLPLTAPGVILS